MEDEAKTRAELIDEVRALRRQLADHQNGAEIVRAEPAARQSAELFAQAFRVNPAAIAITRLADACFVDVNDAFVELLGYAREEVIGHTSQELRLWVDLDTRARMTHLLVEHGVVREFDVRYRTRSGDILDGRTALVFIDIDDEPCVLTIVQNVTEQLWAEQTQRFLIEASTVLTASLDYESILADFVRLAVSHLADWCALDVYAEEGSIRRYVLADTSKDRNSQVALSEWHGAAADVSFGPAQVLRTGQSEIMPQLSDEILAALAEDEHLDFLRLPGAGSAMVVPLTVRGRTLGAITLVRSGGERRYREEDLRLAEDLARRAALAVDNALLYREAQQALHARDAFLSVAAHELKTPTTLILAHAQLLQRRAEQSGASDRDRRSLRMLGSQAERLTQLIQVVLDVSRLQGGELRLNRAAVDLVVIARRVVEELSMVADQHQLVFAGPPEPQVVHGDSLRLEQVLQNLVQNAVKYSPAGSVVRVQIQRRAAEVAVSVSDQGIGVPEAALPELFTPFYRASNIDQGVSGFGIGLYVVKEITTRHGGSVQVTSTEGQGSTFTVLLPLYQPHEEYHS